MQQRMLQQIGMRPCRADTSPAHRGMRHCVKYQPRSRCRTSQVRPVALAPGMCFDSACQAAMDRAFLTATAVPLLGLAGAVAYKFRPLEWQKPEGKQVDLSTSSHWLTFANPYVLLRAHACPHCKGD